MPTGLHNDVLQAKLISLLYVAVTPPATKNFTKDFQIITQCECGLHLTDNKLHEVPLLVLLHSTLQ